MRLEPVTLLGRFVRLEPLSLAHEEPMRRAVAGVPRETFALTQVPTPDEVPAYLAQALGPMARGEALPFATHDVRTGALVGSTRYFDLQRWTWPRGDPRAGQDALLDALEIGYTWLVPQAQRTAINTEAKLLMLGHAFEALGCRRVTLKTDARNQRSRNAIARLGAHFDGVLRAHQPAYDGGVRDTAYFTILAAEWPALRAGLEQKLGR